MLLKDDAINNLHREFFEIMEISEEQKLERIELAELLDDVFLFLFMYVEVFDDFDFNADEYRDMAIMRYEDALEEYGISFTKYPDVKEYVERMANNIVDSTIRQKDKNKQNENTTRNTTTDSNFNGNLNQYGLDMSEGSDKTSKGKGNKSESKQEQIERRAISVAQNEANSVFNRMEYDDAVSSGYTKKTWITEGDNRVRDTHTEVDGLTIPIEEPFFVGDSQLMFPTDTSMGASPRETIRCRCSIVYNKGSKTSLSLQEGNSNDNIAISGAISGALNPYSDRAEEHAVRYYGLVRSMSSDTQKIADNTGYSKEDVSKVKNYIFVDKHDLGNGVEEYFLPNYMMAESWRRLINGDFVEHDLTMLKHELLEISLFEKGLTQEEAHLKATMEYNYQKESDDYYADIEKHNK